jgi:hypothetical protein
LIPSFQIIECGKTQGMAGLRILNRIFFLTWKMKDIIRPITNAFVCRPPVFSNRPQLWSYAVEAKYRTKKTLSLPQCRKGASATRRRIVESRIER